MARLMASLRVRSMGAPPPMLPVDPGITGAPTAGRRPGRLQVRARATAVVHQDWDPEVVRRCTVACRGVRTLAGV